jgi:phosphonate utilization transcriptional regulator
MRNPPTPSTTRRASPRTAGRAAAPAGEPRPPPPDTTPVPAQTATIALMQSTSLPTLVQRELERLILSGDLAAGSKLNETPIAERLGVSRGPVREAFRALQESGLVRLLKNRGVFVRELAPDEADEIYELRAVLDEHVGRQLARSISTAEVAELRNRVAAMEKRAASNDVPGYVVANLDFHDRLVELAGNRKLLETYRRLVNELRLVRHAALAQVGALPLSAREHRDIVDRIAAGKPAAAGRALHDHVTGGRERMHRALESSQQSARPLQRKSP